MSRSLQAKKPIRKRAVLERDKLSKRLSIIQTAANLLLTKDYNELSMDEVAFTSKVAKGTLYLYFPTKEDLYLRVHILDYQHWFDDLKVYLEEAKTEQVSFPDWFVGSFDRHTRFLNSLPIVSAILEKNASVETIREFKSALLTEIHEILPEFTKALGFHSQDDAFTFLMQAHAFAIGAWSHCSPSENVKEVLKDNRFQAFQIDYKAFVKKSVEILLSGYR